MSSLRYKFLRYYLTRLNQKLNKQSYKDIDKHRLRMERYALRMKLAKGVEFTSVNISPVPGEMHFPENLQTNRIILYLHGGGYVSGSSKSHRYLASYIALATESKVLVIDYRLAPEHPFPAGLEDVIKTYKWLLRQGYSSQDIVIMGDSAGGGLALASGIYLRDNGIPLPKGLVGISPWVDLTMSMPSITSNEEKDYVIKENVEHASIAYARSNELTNPLISPLFADLSNLPPILLQVGSDEMLVDEVVEFSQRAKDAGSMVELQVWNGMIHVWHALIALSVPESREAVDMIGDFIKSLEDYETLTSEQLPLEIQI